MQGKQIDPDGLKLPLEPFQLCKADSEPFLWELTALQNTQQKFYDIPAFLHFHLF